MNPDAVKKHFKDTARLMRHSDYRRVIKQALKNAEGMWDSEVIPYCLNEIDTMERRVLVRFAKIEHPQPPSILAEFYNNSLAHLLNQYSYSDEFTGLYLAHLVNMCTCLRIPLNYVPDTVNHEIIKRDHHSRAV